MKLSPVKVLLLFLTAGIFLYSQTVAYACSGEVTTDVQIRCDDEIIDVHHRFLEVYAASRDLRNNSQLRESYVSELAYQKEVEKVEPELQKLEPCHPTLLSAVNLYQAINAELRERNLYRHYLIRLSPIQPNTTVNDDASWYNVNSCYYPWRMANDEWLATASVKKSYCYFDTRTTCEGPLLPSLWFLALEVAGLRETTMPETVRQSFFQYGVIAVAMAVTLFAALTWGTIVLIRKRRNNSSHPKE